MWGSPSGRLIYCGATLTVTDLRFATLSHAHLHVTLRAANLYWAKGFATVMNGAMLAGANLEGANLRRAWAIGVDLSRANLREADASVRVLTTGSRYWRRL